LLLRLYSFPRVADTFAAFYQITGPYELRSLLVAVII
jgi:hypothetical protein